MFVRMLDTHLARLFLFPLPLLSHSTFVSLVVLFMSFQQYGMSGRIQLLFLSWMGEQKTMRGLTAGGRVGVGCARGLLVRIGMLVPVAVRAARESRTETLFLVCGLLFRRRNAVDFDGFWSFSSSPLCFGFLAPWFRSNTCAA